MKTLAVLFLVGLLSAAVAPQVKADAWNQETKVTFSQPVEIPGQVLPQGTYIFRLMDSPSDRNIVQIFNEDGTHLYATVLAIPDYRLQPADKPMLMFEERPVNSPEAIRAWFYPGENYGHEFVYPKSRAIELAQANKQQVPAMSSESAGNTAPVVGVTPEGTVVAQNTASTPPQTSSPNKTTGEEAEKLPKTASPLPLVALLGMIAVVAGLSLRYVAKRIA